jgi:hypothetical protein
VRKRQKLVQIVFLLICLALLLGSLYIVDYALHRLDGSQFAALVSRPLYTRAPDLAPLPTYLTPYATEKTEVVFQEAMKTGWSPMSRRTNISHKEYCDEGYGPVDIDTDSLGYRNPSDIIEVGTPVDILLIGDSYIEGICVDEDWTIRGQLSTLFASANPLHFFRGGESQSTMQV